MKTGIPGDPYFHERVPIFPVKWGPPHPHFTGKIGIPIPIFPVKWGWGSPFSHDTGVTVICVSLGYVFPRTHIPRDMCSPEHISLGLCVPPKGYMFGPTNHPGKTGKIPQNQHSSRIPTASLNFPLFFIKHSSTSFTQWQTFSLFSSLRPLALYIVAPRQGVYCKRSPARNTSTCSPRSPTFKGAASLLSAVTAPRKSNTRIAQEMASLPGQYSYCPGSGVTLWKIPRH